MDESRPQPAIPRKSASARPDVAIHLYEPGDGGLDRVAIHLANGFAARGLTTEIWLTRAEGASRHLLSDSVTIRMIPGMKAPRGLALATQIPVLRQMIRQVRPRVMLSAGNQSNPVIALACMGSDTAAIGKITNPIIRPGQTGLGARWRMMRFRKVTGWSAAMVSLGAGEVDMLAALWPENADKLHFLPLPTVTAPMAAIGAARLNRPPVRPEGGPVQLLSIGRLAFQKDPETMLRALALVRTVDWRMTMVGDGPLRGEAEMSRTPRPSLQPQISSSSPPAGKGCALSRWRRWRADVAWWRPIAPLASLPCSPKRNARCPCRWRMPRHWRGA